MQEIGQLGECEIIPAAEPQKCGERVTEKAEHKASSSTRRKQAKENKRGKGLENIGGEDREPSCKGGG